MRIFRKKNIGSLNFDNIEQDQNYYDKIYASDYPSEKYIPIYKIIIEYINSIGLDKKNILDIGCGVGELAKQIQNEKIENYLGFDFSQNAIKQAKNKVPSFIDNFIVHDCYKLKDINYNYNISIAVEVLEHLNDIKIIKELNPGSYFIGTLPNFWANNNAHLRIYKNKFRIYIRYFKYLKVLKWKKHKLTKDAFINIVLFKVK